MKDVVPFDDLKAPVASADASPVDDSADDDEDDIDVDDNFYSMNGDASTGSYQANGEESGRNQRLNFVNGNKDMDTSKTASLPPNSKLRKDITTGIPFKPNVIALGRTQSVRNFFNRVVYQTGSGFRTLRRRAVVQASGIAGARNNYISGNEGKKHDDAVEERIVAWKKRFAEDGGRVPGVVGIRNHGNTCFMNAILQCLSYTDILAEYLVLDQYKCDLKRKRRLQAITAPLTKGRNGGIGVGSKGEVTEQLATVLKSLWSLQYDPEISIRFKSLVDKHASQYKGGRQHDAQEFLLWLLDQVHEDLNTASRRNKSHKRYKFQVKTGATNANDSKSGSSEVATQNDEAQQAAEALDSYMKSNSSFVMDIFQAQFRSSLTCPTCQRQSNTFDPFLCVSLPIPQKHLLPIYVTVLYIDQCPRQVRLGLTVGAHDSVGELRCTLSKDTGIPLGQLLLVEIDGLTFSRCFRDPQLVTDLKTTTASVKESACEATKKTTTFKGGNTTNSVALPSLYCIEVPHQRQPSEDDGAFVVITWINVLKEGPIEQRFGSPYTIQVSRETQYADLQKLLMKEMASILHDDILISAQKVPLFRIKVVDDLMLSNKKNEGEQNGVSDAEESNLYLNSEHEFPLYSPVVDEAIELCKVSASNAETDSSDASGTGPPIHVKFLLEWDAIAKSQIIADDKDVIEEHSSVKQVQNSPEEATAVSLQECFDLYTKAETLGQGNAWFCPACNRKQEVVKRMGLWSVPDVLVIHLKRFRQSMGSVQGGGHSNGDGVGAAGNGTVAALAGGMAKLSTMVEFPLEGFDMSPNVTNRNNKQISGDATVAKSSLNKDRASLESKNGSTISDMDNKELLITSAETCTQSIPVGPKERNNAYNGATGTLKVLREKCALSSWRTGSTKDDNIKNNLTKNQGVANGISSNKQSTASLSTSRGDSNQSASCDEGFHSRSTEDSVNSYLYDLYAVCNHHGTDLQGGHYTAKCRNPTDGKWYAFDDVHTRPITKPESEVISEDAYILFYQRCSSQILNGSFEQVRSPASSAKAKSLENKKCATPSIAGIVNGAHGENHWVYRMPDFSYKGKTIAPKTGQSGTSGSKQQPIENGKTKITTTTPTSQSATTDIAEKSDLTDISKVDNSDKTVSSQTNLAITSKSDDDNDHFQRNSKGKYATLPAMPKRCLENDSYTKCDTNSSKHICSSNHPSHFSNNEISGKDVTVSDGEVDSENQTNKKATSSPKSRVKFLRSVTEKVPDSDVELDIDIQRPIDKNDVD